MIYFRNYLRLNAYQNTPNGSRRKIKNCVKRMWQYQNQYADEIIEIKNVIIIHHLDKNKQMTLLGVKMNQSAFEFTLFFTTILSNT